MRAWAVSIGSELLAGDITDTNATFLAQECAAAGIDLIRVTQVGDDLAALTGTLRLALKHADTVICTGGLGPTDDDLTREAIAEVAGEQPQSDPDLLRELETFFANRGQQMPARNAKQAWVLPSSTTLPNPIGTAPGWVVTAGAGIIIAMPGVPREMYRMWRDQTLPALQARTGSTVIRSTTIKTLGIGESAAEDEIHDLVMREQPVIATYAKDDGVHIRITATGDEIGQADEALALGVREIEERLGDHIWGRDADALPMVLLQGLEDLGATIATIEAGSGGAFAGMLTSVPATDPTHPLVDARVLPLDLALDHDAARERATALAHRARRTSAATIGLAIVVRGVFDERQVLHGDAIVAVVDAAHEEPELSQSSLRATIDEVQRRSALHAADRLRLSLASYRNS